MSKFINNEKGVMSIDAIISLTLFTFLVMFLIDIAVVYQAQNYVYHGMIQTSKEIAIFTYQVSLVDEFEVDDTGHTTNIAALVERIGNKFNIAALKKMKAQTDMREYWKKGEEADIINMIKAMYPECIAGSNEDADKWLKFYGLKDGMDSIDFKGSKKENQDIVICATFDVNLLFPVFGKDKITLKQSTRARSWEYFDKIDSTGSSHGGGGKSFDDSDEASGSNGGGFR
ncbi:MAG: hypothetical protein K6F77_06830 [Lachnospiraceae bacterium]|nr:hypothetical protein [Lachnospiraceae bacterium]